MTSPSRPARVARYVVGAVQRPALVGIVLSDQRATRGHGEMEAGGLGLCERRVVHESDDPMSVVLELVGRGDGADHGELVSSVASRDVHLACAGRKDVGYEADGVVSGGVAQDVVDGLEVVHVEMHDAVAPPEALEEGEVLLQRRVEVPAVEERAQRIGHR
jgi:hypothetical protein